MTWPLSVLDEGEHSTPRAVHGKPQKTHAHTEQSLWALETVDYESILDLLIQDQSLENQLTGTVH